jgi:multisubunit Na+/H+ antiporter MnhG subunit
MAREIAVGVLLGLAVLIVLVSSLGVLVMRTSFRKLHYLGPASTVAPILVGLAVLVQSGTSSNAGQTWLAIVVLICAGPVLSHATIRAARARAEGDWRGAGRTADGGEQ